MEQGTKNKEQRTINVRRRKGDDIVDRLLDAVEGVRQRLPALQVDAASKHVAKQLWRAITGGGAAASLTPKRSPTKSQRGTKERRHRRSHQVDV